MAGLEVTLYVTPGGAAVLFGRLANDSVGEPGGEGRRHHQGYGPELDAADRESREIGEIVEELDLGPFDEALEELERQERDAGDP